MTLREIIITVSVAVVSPLLVALVIWMVNMNTVDTELERATEQVIKQHEEDIKPLEDRARLSAQKEIRILSEKIIATRAKPDLPPETRAELEALYTGQLDEAQNTFDAYADE
jgi:hypothetical protein